MQWDVAIDELIPQVVRTPDEQGPAAQGAPRSGATRTSKRLEDFSDE